MEEVIRLARVGLNKCAISRATGIPRSTVKSWLLNGLPDGAIAVLPSPSWRTFLRRSTRTSSGVARQPKRRGNGSYHYVRYAFSNRSEDIKQIFCEQLDALGVRWTRANDVMIQIARREAVAIMETIVGPKR